MKLRPYQQDLVDNIHNAWGEGHNNVCGVASTGAGKSVVISDIVRNHSGACVIIAHRQELVSQLSMLLAREGIHHNIIASTSIIKMITKMHQMEYGKIFYRPNSNVAVAGVDTIVRRGEQLRRFLPTVTLWITDETHHLIGGTGDTSRDNKWGKAIRMFENVNIKGLGVTATPLRLDGQGLGRHHDGCLDLIIEGPKMRWLIDNGYLCDYKIYAPVSNIKAENIKVSKSTGDYTQKSISAEISKSSLVVHDKTTKVGDVVSHYMRISMNELAVVFVPSMDVGYELEQQFNNAGISSKLVNAKTPDDIRAETIMKFSQGKYKVLLNVDLFGEGFDLPAISTVIMATLTKSYGKFCQWFGRALRTIEGKEYAKIIDHCGNIAYHGAMYGLPDAPKFKWSLDRRDKRAKSKDERGVNVKICPECSYVYLRLLRQCPDCGFTPVPSNRNSIEEVEGELSELCEAMLDELRGNVANVDRDVNEQVIEYSQGLHNAVNPIHRAAHEKRFRLKVEANQEAQKSLRHVMSYYGGYWRGQGDSDDDIHRRFYIEFNIDWMSAMSLSKDDATVLMINITDNMSI